MQNLSGPLGIAHVRIRPFHHRTDWEFFFVTPAHSPPPPQPAPIKTKHPTGPPNIAKKMSEWQSPPLPCPLIGY